VLFHPAAMSLEEFHRDDDKPVDATIDPQLLAAVKAVVNGKPSRRIPKSYYGYALQEICRSLGRRLADDDQIGEIGSLKLETRLASPRAVAGVPSNGDFPVISFLTEDEVAEEVGKFRSRGMAYPEDLDIEAGSAALLRCLEDAASKGEAITTFYY